MLDIDTVMRIYNEVLAGEVVSTSDSPEEAEKRQRLAQEVAEIEAKGGTPGIPALI